MDVGLYRVSCSGGLAFQGLWTGECGDMAVFFLPVRSECKIRDATRIFEP